MRSGNGDDDGRRKKGNRWTRGRENGQRIVMKWKIMIEAIDTSMLH